MKHYQYLVYKIMKLRIMMRVSECTVEGSTGSAGGLLHGVHILLSYSLCQDMSNRPLFLQAVMLLLHV